ncbi:MAG TPA: MFS transporter, partial [Polyangiaceae bacterium]|nr:MFS transporter [Polyangiaceae bacterium]
MSDAIAGSEAKTAESNVSQTSATRSPAWWVPTSYFAMGTVYIMVSTASNIMFSNLGLTNEQAAAYSSLTGFAFTFKPFWAPLLELFGTKKLWVVAMQLVLGVLFLGLAFALKLPAFVMPVVVLLMVAAVAGATQDIVSDGVYVTSLDSKRQAAFAGIQSMSWSIGPILANGFLVLLVGRLAGESEGGPKPAVEAYTGAWLTVFIGLGVLLFALAGWHALMLPQGEKSHDAPKSFGDALNTFGRVFVTFFQKRDVWKLIGFAFFYRFGLGLLDKIAPLFLLDSTAHGGLGLNNSQLGILNGLIGTTAFIGGSIAGGWFVSRRGLKKS